MNILVTCPPMIKMINKYDDLFTVDNNGTRNGSVRIMKKEFVESGKISRRVGSFVDDCTNIHSEEDLKLAEININALEDQYKKNIFSL